MQGERWAAACAYMASVWHRAIGPVEQAAGLKLLGGLEDDAVEKAITLIAESGRETMPPWSVVYKQAIALRGESSLALPAADVTRDLTPAEAARARLYAEQLRLQIAELAKKRALRRSVDKTDAGNAPQRATTPAPSSRPVSIGNSLPRRQHERHTRAG